MANKKADPESIADILLEEAKDLPQGTLPHDAMNKAIFKHNEVLRGFLQNYVDESFIKELDLSSISALPTEFVSDALSKRFSDTIKMIRWKGQEAYILLILEFQSGKDIWIPVRILAYTALLWLDLLQYKKVKKQGLPPVFPIVIHSGATKWNNILTVQDLIASCPKSLLKYQPQNCALLIDEKLITDEILNNNSDFYALYLLLKRAKTPTEMRDLLIKYKEKLSDPSHYELLKVILAILKTVYRQFNKDADEHDLRFASLEEAVTMLDNTAIDWKKNMQEQFYNEWKNDGKREDALAMLKKGFSFEVIGEITNLPLEEIEKLKASK